MAGKMIGEILLAEKLVNQEQLDEALSLQKTFPKQTIGQLLCKLGFLQEVDLVSILEQSGKRQRLADILLREKLLDNTQLLSATTVSKKNNITLSQAILRLRYLDEAVLAKIIAGQYDYSFVHINTFALEPEIIRYINPIYAQKQRIVPISRIGNTLTLAMAFPLQFHELKELEASIQLRIIPVIAPESEIISAQQRLYNSISSSSEPEAMELDLDISPDSIDDLLSRSAGVNEPDIDEEVKKVSERDSIIVKLVNKIIFDAYADKASDIHIEPYPGKNDIIVRFRIDGLCKIYQRIPYKYKFAIPSRIKIMSDLDIAERRRPQDGKINFKKFGPANIELRVATMPTAGNLEDVVIRLLSTGSPITFDKLGLSERNLRVFDEAIINPHGLILVVGPTGAGKTTTLHSAVAKINNPDLKIWTAEDPVEITQTGLRQVQVNPRIGLTFASVLRSLLRLDPDVILVGEMRDMETASTAVEASLTGHLVLSTLHTNSAAETVTRLLEMGLDPFSFSDSLLCVLAQRLGRTLCASCKKIYTPERDELSALIEEFGVEDFKRLGLRVTDIVLARASGCEKCAGEGYQGRIGIHELLDCTSVMKSLVRKRADTDGIKAQALADGMITLKQDGILKVFKGLMDIHEVRRVCIK